jgi:Secretion system C-terminal sorting domain
MSLIKSISLSIISTCFAFGSQAQWVQDVYQNTPICEASKNQLEPSIMADGVGGSYILWKDYRNLNTPDAFLQRINKNGVQQWIVDGLNVVTNPEDQSTPQMCSDGNNGVIAVWSDFRNGTDRNIYAQRIDSNGTIQWTYNGVQVVGKTIREYNERVISDGEGGAIIVWEQGSASVYDIWAQRIDATGAALWTPGGIAVTTATSAKLNPKLVQQKDGNIVIVWQDGRNGNTDLYAQKMDLNGNRLWTNAAKAVVIAPDRQDEPRITLAANGFDVYIAWVDRRQGNGNTDIYAQRMDSAGAIKWTTSGMPINASINNQNQVEINSRGVANGVVAVWRDFRSGGTSDIYAQKLDSLGMPIYALNGITISTLAGDQLNPVITNDTNGGVIIAWQDKFGGNSNIKAQKLDPAGAAAWATNANVSLAVGDQISPKILADGEDGFICVWEDIRDTANHNIFAHNIGALGSFVPTAIGNINPFQMAVWPNPFQQNLHIEMTVTKQTKCRLMDVFGKEIPSTFINHSTGVDATINAAPGVYFLEISNETSKQVIKVIKQ